jgi:hypothetical protein
MSRFRSVAAPSAIFAIVQDGLIKAVRTIALGLYYHHSRIAFVEEYRSK